jgi:hypothetical protein
MKDLNWFQANDLMAQGRAVRRTGWQKWLFYRFFLGIIQFTDPVTGLPTQRVATTSDQTDQEFLAKDWTDEPWTDATTGNPVGYPPCTVPGPGLGAWTYTTTSCAGGGNGGNILTVQIKAPDELIDGGLYPITAGGEMPAPELMPDGAGCWLTPAHYQLYFWYRINPSILPLGWDGSAGDIVARVFIWISSTGATDFGDIPASFLPTAGDHGYPANGGIDGVDVFSQQQNIPSGMVDVGNNAHWIYPDENFGNRRVVVPGARFTGRITVTTSGAPADGVAQPLTVLASRDFEYTFANYCNTYL